MSLSHRVLGLLLILLLPLLLTACLPKTGDTGEKGTAPTTPQQTGKKDDARVVSSQFVPDTVGIDRVLGGRYSQGGYMHYDVRYSKEDQLAVLKAVLSEDTQFPHDSIFAEEYLEAAGLEEFDDYQETESSYISQYTLLMEGNTVVLKDGAFLDVVGNEQVSIEKQENDLVITVEGEEVAQVIVPNPVDRYLDFQGRGGRDIEFAIEPDGVIVFTLAPGRVFDRAAMYYSEHQIFTAEKSEFADWNDPLDKSAWYKSAEVYPSDIELRYKFRSRGNGTETDITHLGIYRFVDTKGISNDDQEDFGLAEGELLDYPTRKEEVGLRKDLVDSRMRKMSYEPQEAPRIASNAQGVTLSLQTPSRSGKYILYMRDVNQYEHLLMFEIQEEGEVTLEDFPEELRLEVGSIHFPLDEEQLREQLTEYLGVDGFKLSETRREAKGYYYDIEYYIPPKTEVEVDMILENVYGKQTPAAIDLYIEKIPTAYIQARVQGNALNILPKFGYRGDKIEVTHRNLPSFDLYFQSCALRAPDLSKYRGVYVEYHIFNCEGKVVSETYDFADSSDWWTTYDEVIPLPDELAGADYFRVSFGEDFGLESKYFTRSNIGLLAKIAGDQAYVWAYQFDTGLPLATTVRVLDDTRAELGSVNLSDGHGVLDLAVYDEDILILEAEIKKEPQLQEAKEKKLEMKDGKLQIVKDIKGSLSNRNVNEPEQKYNQDDRSFIVLQRNGHARYYLNDTAGGNYRHFTFASRIDSRDLYQESPRRRWSDDDMTKIYGYTDRGLYRAGDTVFYAGFVRDLAELGTANHIPSGMVRVSLTDAQGAEVGYQEIQDLDEYGGFFGSFELAEEVSLGTYYVLYEFGDRQYSHDVRVEEFQKPTFYVEATTEFDENQMRLLLEPTYYFGSPVADVDVAVEWTVVQDNVCWYCRWWNEETMYYNHVFAQAPSDGGSINVHGWTGGALEVDLLHLSDLESKGYKINIQAQVSVKDNASDETQFTTINVAWEPEVKLGLEGQPVEWIYGSRGEKYAIEGTRAGVADETRYIRYFQPYGHTYQYGVDRSRYYVDGKQFTELGSGVINDKKFTVPTDELFAEPGTYFLRVVSYDDVGTVLSEVQKRIQYYDWSRYSYNNSYMGQIKNNFQLAVNVAPKSYGIDDMIPLDIDPYVKGASVLVTVEKGKEILDSYTYVLDGEPLAIPVKQNYYPNVNISVTQIVGENISLSEKRKEPRFFMGYTQVDIDEELVKLDIEITTDKQVYEPGEQVKFVIKTRDGAGNPVDARLSVGVVDKALVDLYHLIKEPIPHFYNKVGSMVANFTNMKLLYQALEVMVADGSKGGGGMGSFGQLVTVRENFEDIAYWRGKVITENGVAELETSLPDNLTTWMIDVIAITKDAKLGTETYDFNVTKPLLVEPNLPLFLTLGDQLALPVKVIVDEAHADDIAANARLEVQGTMTTESGEEYDLGSVRVQPNKKALFDLEVPMEVFAEEQVTVQFAVSHKGYSDVVKRTIPLRTDGFVLHDYEFSMEQEGSRSFDFRYTVDFADISLTISPFPIRAFSEALEYLLRYPYGCTEQLMSSLYPLATALQLSEQGLLGAEHVKDGKVKLDRGRQETKGVVRAGFNKIFKHQKVNGGMGYWTDDEAYYPVSAYVYGAMKIYEQLGYTIHTDNLAALESYLEKSDAGDDKYRLYYLWNKSFTSTDINLADMKALWALAAENDPDTLSKKILAFAIYANVGETDNAQALYEMIDSDALGGESSGYKVYFGDDVLKAIMLRALIRLEQDQSEVSYADPIRELIEEFLGGRDTTGAWGWSTQKNVHILLALGDYLLSLNKQQDDLSCEITIDDERYELSLDEGAYSKDLMQRIEQGTETILTWSCNRELMMDAKVDYLYSDMSQITSQLEQVSILDLEIDDQDADVGETVQIQGSFAPKKEARQVAVEFFIPASLKLLESISAKTDDDDRDRYRDQRYPFTISGGRGCRPTHWEVRFDRLFLYYDSLTANKRCEVTIDALKAYEGETNVMPTRLREMYRTDVWGRKVYEK